MSRSLSWFDEEALRKLFSGAGARVRARQGVRGPTLITVTSSVTPSTLVGQFGHANRFATSPAAYGRFAAAASTQPGPPPDVEIPRIVEGGAPFDPKATRLAAGTSPPPDERAAAGTRPPPDDSVDAAPAWMAANEPGAA